MTYKEALDSLVFELDEEGHCSYIEEELRKAFKALEKQIPMKITEFKECEWCVDWLCPSCGKFHRTEWEMDYCSECGQAVEWSKE